VPTSKLVGYGFIQGVRKLMSLQNSRNAKRTNFLRYGKTGIHSLDLPSPPSAWDTSKHYGRFVIGHRHPTRASLLISKRRSKNYGVAKADNLSSQWFLLLLLFFFFLLYPANNSAILFRVKLHEEISHKCHEPILLGGTRANRVHEVRFMYVSLRTHSSSLGAAFSSVSSKSGALRMRQREWHIQAKSDRFSGCHRASWLLQSFDFVWHCALFSAYLLPDIFSHSNRKKNASLEPWLLAQVYPSLSQHQPRLSAWALPPTHLLPRRKNAVNLTDKYKRIHFGLTIKMQFTTYLNY